MINSLNASFSDMDELFLITTKFIFIFFAFLKDTFSLTLKGYYTQIGIGLGSSFGILFGILLNRH